MALSRLFCADMPLKIDEPNQSIQSSFLLIDNYIYVMI